MLNAAQFNLFREALASMRGRKVFCVYCGSTTGSVIDIHLSPIKPRRNALRNPTLPQIHRENMGRCSLFVECSWRLEGDSIIAGSGDVIDNSEDVFSAVKKLEGLSISNVILPTSDPVLDVAIVFEDGKQFKLFCDSGFGNQDNYSVFHDNETVFVVSGGDIRLEPQDSEE